MCTWSGEIEWEVQWMAWRAGLVNLPRESNGPDAASLIELMLLALVWGWCWCMIPSGCGPTGSTHTACWGREDGRFWSNRWTPLGCHDNCCCLKPPIRSLLQMLVSAAAGIRISAGNDVQQLHCWLHHPRLIINALPVFPSCSPYIYGICCCWVMLPSCSACVPSIQFNFCRNMSSDMFTANGISLEIAIIFPIGQLQLNLLPNLVLRGTS